MKDLIKATASKIFDFPSEFFSDWKLIKTSELEGRKSGYRKKGIVKPSDRNDDFGAMDEVIVRKGEGLVRTPYGMCPKSIFDGSIDAVCL